MPVSEPVSVGGPSPRAMADTGSQLLIARGERPDFLGRLPRGVEFARPQQPAPLPEPPPTPFSVEELRLQRGLPQDFEPAIARAVQQGLIDPTKMLTNSVGIMEMGDGRVITVDQTGYDNARAELIKGADSPSKLALASEGIDYTTGERLQPMLSQQSSGPEGVSYVSGFERQPAPPEAFASAMAKEAEIAQVQAATLEPVLQRARIAGEIADADAARARIPSAEDADLQRRLKESQIAENEAQAARALREPGAEAKVNTNVIKVGNKKSPQTIQGTAGVPALLTGLGYKDLSKADLSKATVTSTSSPKEIIAGIAEGDSKAAPANALVLGVMLDRNPALVEEIRKEARLIGDEDVREQFMRALNAYEQGYMASQRPGGVTERVPEQTTSDAFDEDEAEGFFLE
jgi:hypothetical protein